MRLGVNQRILKCTKQEHKPSSLAAALHTRHNIWQKVVSVFLGDTEHLNIVSVPDFFHEGQRFSFRYWDRTQDYSPWGGQRLTNSLDKRLTEELHLPNLIDDTHPLPWATAGTCIPQDWKCQELKGSQIHHILSDSAFTFSRRRL